MNRTIFVTGTVLGLSSVVLGAFGAHGLEQMVAAKAVNTFETGVKYQMYHALFLLLLGSMAGIPEKAKKWIFYCVLFGILLFSCSIYLLATNSLSAFDFRSIGFLTPLGGLFLIAGWVLLGVYVLKHLGKHP